LPRYAFTPPSPSEYRIRKEPHANYVSTIEALVYVLGALEGDPARFRALLQPFRAMVDAQIEHAVRLRGARIRHKKTGKPPLPRIPSCLTDRTADLVCVVGEANAWPYRVASRAIYPDVLVHWVARRLSTGETFDFIAAPSTPLAPGTLVHTRLSHDDLAKGGSVQELFDRWKSFARPTDVVCSWGRYATSLFASSGGDLPGERIDLRQVARRFTRAKVGTLEAFAAGIGIPRQGPPGVVGESSITARGRAGVRLRQVEDIARYFNAAASRRPDETISPV
jgi:DTW domain-containing protein